MSFYKTIIKPIFFRQDPETVHYKAMSYLNTVLKFPGAKTFFKNQFQLKDEKLERTVFGIKFPNPVGLAAGFDKDAKFFNELSHLGFGFIEIGTVTPKPQAGNDKPRLFRLPQDEGLINRMGFNNDGVEEAISRLRKRTSNIIIGGNIGKNKVTPNDRAIDDYEYCFNALYNFVDYFVVNVSSPNTPGLRELQEKGPLTKILQRLKDLDKQKGASKPILLKIAPDLTNDQLDDIVDIISEVKLAGVIATNTTISREDLSTPNENIEEIGAGGLSGKPVRDRATEVIKYLADKSKKSFAIIGVGGIHKGEDAIEKLQAGADLVQVYTGFIYEGPGMIKEINKEILKNN